MGSPPEVSLATCKKIVEGVQNWDAKPVNCKVFTRDLLAVVCGIRPAVFCDEVLFKGSSLPKIPNFLRWVQNSTGVHVAAMVYKDPSWNVEGELGVLYLVNVDCLKKKCKQDLQERRYPTYLFGTSTGVTIVEQCEVLTQTLVKAVVDILERIEGDPEGVLSLQDLGDFGDLMPMLNGWMLEYPVVYANHSSAVKLDGKPVALSLNDRVVVRCFIQSTIVVARPQKVANGKIRQLFSFSIPRGLLHGDEIIEMTGRIQHQFMERRDAHQDLWGPVAVKIEEPQNIVWAS